MSDSVRKVRANTVRMPEELWQALQAESERTGQSSGDMIRQAVTLYLAWLAALRATNDDGDLRELLAEVVRRRAV